MAVDRCICHQISFSEIKRISDENNVTSIEELQVRRVCSTNCRLCVPYIKLMLETGDTSFSPADIFDHSNQK